MTIGKHIIVRFLVDDIHVTSLELVLPSRTRAASLHKSSQVLVPAILGVVTRHIHVNAQKRIHGMRHCSGSGGDRMLRNWGSRRGIWRRPISGIHSHAAENHRGIDIRHDSKALRGRQGTIQVGNLKVENGVKGDIEIRHRPGGTTHASVTTRKGRRILSLLNPVRRVNRTRLGKTRPQIIGTGDPRAHTQKLRGRKLKSPGLGRGVITVTIKGGTPGISHTSCSNRRSPDYLKLDAAPRYTHLVVQRSISLILDVVIEQRPDGHNALHYLRGSRCHPDRSRGLPRRNANIINDPVVEHLACEVRTRPLRPAAENGAGHASITAIYSRTGRSASISRPGSPASAAHH